MSLTFLFFMVLAILAVASAVVTISSRHPVASALSLVFHFFMLAGLYLTLQAQFLAVIQILVYAGAIMVLVVFVIMLLNLGDEEKLKEKYNWRKGLAVILGLSLALQLVSLIMSSGKSNPELSNKAIEIGGVNYLGDYLMNNYMLGIEFIGILLLATIIGAVVLAKRKI